MVTRIRGPLLLVSVATRIRFPLLLVSVATATRICSPLALDLPCSVPLNNGYE